jgi:peptide chain release factor subunit 3
MDDPSVQWSEARYNEIVEKTTPFFKQNGYNTKSTDSVEFIPISGLGGQNLKERGIPKEGDWYKGQTFWELLDCVKMPDRDAAMGFRVPLLDGFKEEGQIMGIGKVEQGTISVGDKTIIMPTKVPTEILTIYIEDDEVKWAKPGENIRVKLKGVEEDQVCKGFVLCPLKDPQHSCTRMKVQVVVLELLEARPLLTAGYQCIMHVHTSVEEASIVKLYTVQDKKTKAITKAPKFAKEGNILVCGIEVVQQVAAAPFATTPQLGRFTLRDEGKTIAIGKILEVSNK